MCMKKFTMYIGIILLVSIFFRFVGLSSRDTLSDEANYGFRSLGYIDYDHEPVLHSTPIEWYDPKPPEWLSYSFHDAPPLFFYLQHLSFRVFGDSRFALRFPSALFGTLSALLIIAIGSILYNGRVGLIAGALSAVSVSSVYISRVGIIESTLIFFLLLTNVLFLLALKRRWLFLFVGVCFGLSMLTKYTAIVFLPISIVYTWFAERKILHDWRFWTGYIIAGIMQTPIILYNLYLYMNFGHLDFALMNLFGEAPEVWQSNPGRDIGTVWERIVSFVPQLFFTHFWLMVVIFFISLGYLAWRIGKDPAARLKRHAYILISYVFFVILIVTLGPAPRFLSMAGPYMRLIIAFCVYTLWNTLKSPYKDIVKAGMICVFLLAVGYAVNSFVLPHPIGPWKLAYGAVVRNSFKWGYAELGDYLRMELAQKKPAFILRPRYEFLKTIRDARIVKVENRGYAPYSAIIIYDQNIARMPEHWIFDRLHVYKNWPILTTEDYEKMLKEVGVANLQLMDPTFYFIIPFDDIALKQERRQTTAGKKFEAILIKNNIKPVYIKTFDNYFSFRVYKWQGNLDK